MKKVTLTSTAASKPASCISGATASIVRSRTMRCVSFAYFATLLRMPPTSASLLLPPLPPPAASRCCSACLRCVRILNH